MAGVLAFIPARSGSKGLPGKNIKLLNGIPLLAHAIRTAKDVPGITRIIVSTDSQEYADIAIEYGAEVPFLRPAPLAGDSSRILETVLHLVDNIEDLPEMIAMLHPTTPMRDVGVINNAIWHLQARPEINGLASVNKTPCSGWRCKTIECGFLKDYKDEVFRIGGKNRQEATQTYNLNGYIYLWRTAYIKKHRRVWGKKTLAFKTPDSIDIDTLKDFEYLEYILRNKSWPTETKQLASQVIPERVACQKTR